MFQAFGSGGGLCQMTIFINGIGCNFICWHFQSYCALLDGRKAQMPTHILALHKIKITSINNIQIMQNVSHFILYFL
jgi:hypothetical protein